MSQLATPPLKSILRYPGGKARIATWIVKHLPPHDTYVEPFFGGGSVFFAKQRARIEVINDLDDRVVNLYRVLRERPDELIRAVVMTPYALTEYEASCDLTGDPLEDARRFLIRVQMSHAGKLGVKSGWRRGSYGGYGGEWGSIARPWANLPERMIPVVERLAEVMIECRPALEVIRGWNRADVLLYCDPPYVPATRSGARLYRHEMSESDHIELLEALDRHSGPVVLSGYADPLYDDRLQGWKRIDRPSRTYRAGQRVESLWLNPVAADHNRQQHLEMGVHS